MNLKKIRKGILYVLPLVAIILLCPPITIKKLVESFGVVCGILIGIIISIGFFYFSVLWFFEGLLSILEGITEKGDEEGEK